MGIKKFKEWMEGRRLLSELSPDLLHRAADAGEKKAAANHTPYLAAAERERARRFRRAGHENFNLELEVAPEDEDVKEKVFYPLRVVRIEGDKNEDGSLWNIYRITVNQQIVKRKEFRDYGYYPMGGTLNFNAESGELSKFVPGGPNLRLELDRESGERLVARINSIFGADYKWRG